MHAKPRHRLNNKVLRVSQVTDIQVHSKATSRMEAALLCHRSAMVKLTVRVKVSTDNNKVAWFTRKETATCSTHHTILIPRTVNRVRSTSSVSDMRTIQRAHSDRTAENQPNHY